METTANKYYATLNSVNVLYKKNFELLDSMVNVLDRRDYNTFSEKEKLVVENTVRLVGLLYEMCKVQLVLKSEGEQLNRINYDDIIASTENAGRVIEQVA